jgi:transcriptional regulator with XRE-family HTH domain
MTPTVGAGRLVGAHGRVGHRGLFDRAITGQTERELLAAGLGALLAAERRARGWSVRELAAAGGCAHTTVLRLESGHRRPRPALLRSLADALAADRADALAEQLATAVGGSLRADTPAGSRARRRRSRRARLREYHALRLKRALFDAWIAATITDMEALDVRPLRAARRLDATPEQVDEASRVLDRLEAQRRHRQRLYDIERAIGSHLRAGHPVTDSDLKRWKALRW